SEPPNPRPPQSCCGLLFSLVPDNGTVAFDRSDSYTFAGAISGSGAVSQIGSGTTILTGDSTYSGGTTISAAPATSLIMQLWSSTSRPMPASPPSSPAPAR
ncbi:hypothetical protein EN813_050910, partial [Mesorhizobium sp. M00.F.Ca.ET.170.01.1.1]